MKKNLILLIAFFILFNIVSAQKNQTEKDSLTKKIKKSDTEIQNPKKNIKPETWGNRGKIFIDAYSVNFKYLAEGINADIIPFLGISESNPKPFYGKPLKTYVEGDFTIWEYECIKIYIDKDGLVSHWEETEISFPGALGKAYEAYTKAIELNVGKKYITKNSTVNEIK